MRRLTVAVLVLLCVPAAAHAQTATQLSSGPLAESATWKRLVLDQNDGLVYPKHVYVVAGSRAQVDDPAGLEAAGGGVTTIHSTGQGTPRLELDLGINTGGYVEVGITKTDGTTVHLGYSEARRFLTPDGDGSSSLGNDDQPDSRSDDVSAAGAFRSPAIRGSQRWISLQLQGAGTVSIDYVRVREEHLHPGIADYTGHFLSSDDQLNRVWYAGVYTFANDSFKDLRPGHDKGNVVVTDGAKRDRLVWLGDLVIENMLGGYALRESPQIIKDSIQIFSCQQDTDGYIVSDSQIETVCPDTPPQPTQGDSGLVVLPEYTAWWVAAVHDYDLFTGDDPFARRMMPVVRRAMTYFTSHLDANGLFSTPPGSINWHPFDDAAGEDAHTNATIYRALLDAAQLERRVGDGNAAAAAYDQQAAALRQAMLAHLWDATAGAFLLNASDPNANHTQDAQVEAVLDGVVTGDQAASAMTWVTDRLATTYGTKNGESDQDPYMSNYVSPYISSTELLARLSRFDAAGALALLRREWGHQVDTDPNSTLWEKMTFDGDAASYSPNQVGNGVVPSAAGQGNSSLSHGWAGGPVPALSGYILGIRPVTPGFATWMVQPQTGDLAFAQGQAPSPRGVIVSRWQRGDGDRSFVLTAGGPAGTSGSVYVPLLGQPRSIARDGVPVTPSAVEGDYARFDGVTGTHTWAWSADGVGAAVRTCGSRRSIVVHLRRGRGSGIVFADGRRVGHLRRGRGMRLRFPGRGRSTVTVRITTRGKRTDIRRYHLCGAGR